MKETPRVLARVSAMVPWPDHGRSDTPNKYSAEKLRAKGIYHSPSAAYPIVFGLGTPSEPESLWDCGTDVVWPVLEINGIPIESEDGWRPYVCRHEIIAGD